MNRFTDFVHYTVCDGSGEDPRCSDSIIPDSVYDHVSYLGINVNDGKPYGC